jgi:hypothetical protein
MASTNKPTGGVGSPFKAKFTQMPAGKSAIKQIEEETKTFGENIQTIAGGVGGAVGNIKQGINNFLTTIGLEPRGEKELETDVDRETIDKSRKKLGISQYQWDTGGVGTDAMTQAAIKREKKKLGLRGKVVETEVANPDYVDEETTPDIDPTITKKQRQYEEYNIFTGKKNKYVWDPSAGEYKLEGQQEEEEASTDIEGGVDGDPVEEKTEEVTTSENDSLQAADVAFSRLTDGTYDIDQSVLNDPSVYSYEYNEGVEEYQNALIEAGFGELLGEEGADGKWGPNTQKAHEQFMAKHSETFGEESIYNPGYEAYLKRLEKELGLSEDDTETEQEVEESATEEEVADSSIDGGVEPPEEDLTGKSTNELREILKDTPYYSEQRKEIYDKLGWKYDKTVDRNITEEIEQTETDEETPVDDKGSIPENEQYTYYNSETKSEETIRITNDDVKRAMSDVRLSQSKKVLEDLLGVEISDRDYLLNYTNKLVENDDANMKKLTSTQGINSNLINQNKAAFMKEVYTAWKEWDRGGKANWDNIRIKYGLNSKMIIALGEKFNEQVKNKEIIL